MTEEALGYIDNLLSSLGIPYALDEWTEEVPDGCYFSGTYSEIVGSTLEEDGKQESTFILRGFTRGSRLVLEQAKNTIAAGVLNLTDILPNGNGIAISYENAMPVPTYDAEIRSIMINLNIKEWKVNP